MTNDDMTETRLRIAQTRGLPDAIAERLQGTTEAELAADADALMPLLATRLRSPAPDPGQGPRPMTFGDPDYEAYAAVMNLPSQRRRRG